MRIMRRRRPTSTLELAPRLLLAAPALIALAAPAAAQQSAAPISALRNHDADAPIDVDADRIEVRDADAQALFSGSVKVRQGDLGLDANQIRVFYRRAGSEDLTVLRLDAEGAVRLTSPSERASSRFGVYDVEERQLTMVGDVVLNRGDSVLRGQRLTIDLESGRSTLEGGARPGGDARSEAPGAAGRVSGRFVVPEKAGAEKARPEKADGDR